MEQSGFTVCVEFGTSKIVGILARRNEQGIITILASETIPSDSCVRHGVIYNIDEAAGKFKKLINLLENKSGKKIGKVYASVSGMSLRAIEHFETKVQDTGAQITVATLDRMEEQAKQNKPDYLANYSVLSPEYYLDGKFDEDPIGKTVSVVEGHYRLIVGRPNIKANLQKTITEKNKIDIAGLIVGASAAGNIMLSRDDTEAGCALVDFGAGTTTVSVYKNKLLRHMVVIPFGGKTITKDIAELGFALASAETYKIRYGKIGKDKIKPTREVSPDVDLRELNKVIQLRQDEILLNVINQIKLSGYGDQLGAGIVVVGGASQLNGLVEHFAEKAQMPVKRAVVERVFINNIIDILHNPAYSQPLGLLLFANDNCEKKEVREAPEPAQPTVAETIPQQPTAPEKKAENRQHDDVGGKKKKGLGIGNIFGGLKDTIGTLFDSEE